MAWVKPRAYNRFQRLIDFGNGLNINNIVCALNDDYQYPYFAIHSTSITYYKANKNILLNKWQHFTCVLSDYSKMIYIDGIQSLNAFDTILPDNVNRILNYVGRSNWKNHTNDQDGDYDIDDLKIFSRALNEQEIKFEMSNSIY